MVFLILCHFDQKHHGNLSEFRCNPLCYDILKEMSSRIWQTSTQHMTIMVLMDIIIVVMGDVADIEKAKRAW